MLGARDTWLKTFKFAHVETNVNDRNKMQDCHGTAVTWWVVAMELADGINTTDHYTKEISRLKNDEVSTPKNGSALRSQDKTAHQA